MDPLPLVVRRIPLRPKLSRLKPPARPRLCPTRSPLASSSFLPTRSSTQPFLPSIRFSPHARRSLHSAGASAGLPPAVKTLTAKLGETQPCFPIRGDEIQVLSEPEEFFKALLDLIKRARRRLYISSLYIGVEQDELIAALRSALAAQPQLRVTFILDYHRCTREPYPRPSTASVLSALVRDHPGRVEAWFFRSPKLKGLMELLVPRRFDEGFGTWHSKVYAGDEEVIISGANLSKDYFTTRQDRYFYFRNSLHFTTYLANLLRLYTQYSYLLVPLPSSSPDSRTSTESFLAPLLSIIPFSSSSSPQPYTLSWQNSNVDPRAFTDHAFATISTFQRSWLTRTKTFAGRRVDADTSVYPALQAGPLGLNEEVNGMSAVWDCVEGLVQEEEKAEEARNGRERKGVRRPRVELTTGYFGLYEGYKKRVLEGKGDVRIVAASPAANGFFQSKGVSGLIPEGYTLLEREFEREVRRRGREWKDFVPSPAQGGEKKEGDGSGVELTEWEKHGWTYHAKGIWLSSSPSRAPLLTLLGSSNLSTRSIKLDIETSFFITTTSSELQSALKKEVAGLRKWSEGTRVGEETWQREDRKVSWRCWWIMRVLRVENLL